MPLARDDAPVHHDPVRLAASLRSAKGETTQTKLAELTGIDQGRLSRILNYSRNETPTLDEIVRIEVALGLPLGYVLAAAGYVTPAGVKAGARAKVVDVRRDNART